MSILICAYAHVPGPNSATVAVESLIQSVHSQVDAVTLKAPGQSHMERVQNGRLFRVPVEGARAARRAAFCRAVKRQFDSHPYRAVQVRGPLEGLALLPLRESPSCFPDSTSPILTASPAATHGLSYTPR